MAIDITDWNYNHLTGAVMDLLSVQSAILRASGTGWHGPFATKEEALAFYLSHKDAHPDWKEPTGLVGNLKNAAGIPAQVAQGVTDPLGRLNLGGWVIRIAEIMLGVVLIGVGIAKLTGATNAIAKIAKVAVP